MPDLSHSYQIKKTEFITQKDHSDADGVSLQLLDSTCLINYQMNRNNVLGGNNIIYLNGSYITFYNFFQNSKQFGMSVCSHRTVGMVGNNSGRGIVAIVSQKQDKSELYVSVYSYCEEYVPTHIIRGQLHFIDIVMLRQNYLVMAVLDLGTKQYAVYILHSKVIEKTVYKYAIKRLVSQDHKIYVIFQQGGISQLQYQKIMEKNTNEIEHADKKVDDYCQIQNQARVILYQGNKLYCYWYQSQKQYILDFSKHLQKCKANRIIKVGRNILVTHRNSLTISHFVLSEENLIFGGNHTYQEKIKGGILSIQSSQDQMHATLAVQVIQKDEIKIENFIFNLSSISKSHKFICPFTRLTPMGSDFGSFCSMQNILSSNSYMLIGSKIYNLFNSTILQRKQNYNLYQTPKFMTVHPLGHQFLCGFDNIIKFYNKVQKDMHEIWSEQFICTAAKYSKSGGLVLSCVQDGFTSVVIYDCYNFKKVRTVPIALLKMWVSKIQWCMNNTEIVLSSNTQMLKINLFNGQKIIQFRDKKDGPIIKYIEYDIFYDRVIAATSGNGFIIAEKVQQANNYNLGNIKTVKFNEEISCIKINNGLKSIFFGCKSGNMYWGKYPLKLKSIDQQSHQYFQLNQDLQIIKIHNNPILSIDNTTNNKFLVITIQNHGYFSFRMRKLRSKDSNMNILFQELGNPILNTIQTSSTTNYLNNKEKLKISLEKRKQCFSDLEEFRREWDIKFAIASKAIQMNSKKNQLNFINQTLASIQQVKEKKKAIQASIEKIVEEMQQKKSTREQNYVKEMLELYQEQQKRKLIFQQKKNQYEKQYQSLVDSCNQNLKQIQEDLALKRSNFQNNYKIMVQNLENFQKRYLYEIQEEPEERRLEIQEHLKNLQVQEIQLTRVSNDLSVKITQSRKQYERYCNRKNFLELKNSFFFEQNIKCVRQKTRLLDLKQKLECQLKQLESYTDKKQKKLRVYLKANEALRKYKQIHQNLSQNAVREAEFIKSQQQKLDENIVNIQKELSSLASTNEVSQNEIKQLQNEVVKLKSQSSKLNKKMKSVGYYLTQILGAMSEIGYSKNQAERLEKLKKIYNYFYVERSVQSMIERQTRNQPNYQQNFMNQRNEKLKTQQSKILNQLKNQKNYIINNIDVFKNYNKRINQQINLNFLQIQAQNYSLIAQCNLRKQQTANKKKALHQLIDSVKETQIYLDQMKKENNTQVKKLKRERKTAKVSPEVPYVIFERQKLMKAQSIKPRTSQQGPTFSKFKANSQKGFGNIRKMLDIKSLQDNEQRIGFRRIQTAKIKKVQAPQFVQDNENSIIKPMTATFKRRRQALRSAMSIKNKSSSKPSTCATYSANKYSIAH